MSANTTHSIPEFEFRKGTNKLEIVTADFGTVVKAVYREGIYSEISCCMRQLFIAGHSD